MMKKWLSLLLLLLLPMTAALADEAVIEWFMIEDQIRTGKSGVVSVTDDDGSVTHAVDVRVKGSVYTISTASSMPQGMQAVICDVRIDARDTDAYRYYVRPDDVDGVEEGIVPSPAGTYVFKDVAIAGERMEVFAYEWYDTAHEERHKEQDKKSETLVISPVSRYAVRLEESVALLDGISIDILAGDDVSMDKRGTQWHSFHGGRVDFEMLSAAGDVNLLSECQGAIDAEITGQTDSITMSVYNGANVTLRNLVKDKADAKRRSTIYASIADGSTGNLVNARDLAGLTLESVDGSKLTAENRTDVGIGMLSIHSEVRSHVHFTNDGVILNEYGFDGNSWGDQAMELGIDETSHLVMVGKGKIMPGYQWFDYYLGDSDMKFAKPKPGASIIINLSNSSFELSGYAENVEMVRKVANRIELDWEQIERGRRGFTWPDSDGSETPPHSVLAVYRDERAFIWPVTKSSVYHPALKHEKELDVLPADYDVTRETRAAAPKVLLEDGVAEDTDVYLSIADTQKGSGTVRYELSMVDAWGGAYDPGKPATLYLPYPAIEDAQTREYEVFHTLKDGSVEYYSTLDGTLRRLDNGSGMVMEVRSFSPFEIRWDEGGSMPDTGDASRAGLWLALLGLSGVMLAGLKRRRA